MAAAMAAAAGLPADLRKRIEIMAEHIARNGPEFEATVRQKNTSNPQFAFLFSGEGSEYYQHVLSSHRPPAPSAAPTAAPASSASCGFADSAAWSNGTGVPYGAAVVEGLKALRRRWPEPPAFPLGPEAAAKLSDIVDSLEALASRDAIRAGRTWIEANAALGQQIAGYVMKRIPGLPSSSHKLHVLYLVHDLLQTEAARKDPSQPLIKIFKPYLVWMLRPAYQLCDSEEEGSRVLRLLELWVERSILTSEETDEIRSLVTPAELPPPERAPVAVAPPSATEASRQPLQSQLQRPQFVQPRAPPRPVLPRPPSGGFAGYAAKAGAGAVPAVRPSAAPAPGAVRSPYSAAGMPHAAPRPSPIGSLAAYPAFPPRGQGLARSQGVSTPETVPVGVMATMLLGMKRHKKMTRANFVPYVPLEGAQTPQGLPPMVQPTPLLLERVGDFYQDLREDERSSSSSSSSRSRSRSRSRSPGRSKRGVWASGAKAAPSHGAVPPPML